MANFPENYNLFAEKIQQNLHKQINNIGGNYSKLDTNQIKWENLSCFYYDSEGDRNDLSDDEDLESAKEYAQSKNLRRLECGLTTKQGQSIDSYLMYLNQM